jgi:hypothetical protein
MRSKDYNFVLFTVRRGSCKTSNKTPKKFCEHAFVFRKHRPKVPVPGSVLRIPDPRELGTSVLALVMG